jgi:hypothetical protein
LRKPVLLTLAFACSASMLVAPSAGAQVTEPNGTVVPQIIVAADYVEQTLTDFFTDLGEPIDPVSDASAEPGVFSPRCDFRAALVLSESQALAGVAWYNVPSDPNAAPAEVFTIVPPETPVGQVITSGDIRTNPA